MLIKKGKTNIKYLLIVVILAAIVGGSIFWYVMKQETQLPENIKKIEISEGVVDKIINEVLPSKFDMENARYNINDLNEDGYPEIIITAVQLRNGYFTILTVLDEKGNYEKDGSLEYEEAFRGIPVVEDVQDIDNDNQKEIFLSLGFGGASTMAEGILDWDFSNKKLDWVKFQDETGNTENAIFWVGASAMHHHVYTIDDLDKDGQKEIIKIDAWGEYKKPEDLEPWEILIPMVTPMGEEEMWWRCQARAYEWNGLAFSYNEELSKKMFSRLEYDCMIEGY